MANVQAMIQIQDHTGIRPKRFLLAASCCNFTPFALRRALLLPPRAPGEVD